MEIKKGDTFLCIKDMFMISGSLRYREGEIYTSEGDGCITNICSNKNHSWKNKDLILEYFKKIESEGIKSLEGVKKDDGKLPYYTVLFKQFPLALKEVVKCSQAGHEKYKATDLDWQNFSRVEGADIRYKEAAVRHMTEEGIIEDMAPYGEMTHEAAVIWNFLADMEVRLRKEI